MPTAIPRKPRREPVDEPYAEPPLPRMVSEPPDADEVDAPLIPLVASRT